MASKTKVLPFRMQLRAGDILVYQVVEVLTEGLIYFMVVFGPWAFGTTQAWAVRVMNGAGYALGVLLAMKLAIRWLKGYRAPKWGVRSAEFGVGKEAGEPTSNFQLSTSNVQSSTFNVQPATCNEGVTVERVLAGLTLLILGFCLVSAWNAKATYLRGALRFDYHPYIAWLPHSFDSGSSWGVFWNYLAMACAFWAIRDFLLGKTTDEQLVGRGTGLGAGLSGAAGWTPFLPARLRRLLWVLCVSGGLLGVEAIAQRLAGSDKLLWFVQPRVNPGGITHLGPYAYRSNGAQWLNLVWPVCLGFWWTLHRSAGSRRKGHHWLLPCAVAMAVCALMSASRGGALVAAGMAVLAACFLTLMHFLFDVGKRSGARRKALWALLVAFVLMLGVGFELGWKDLQPRMMEAEVNLAGREGMYDLARPMARDYPWYGTGPGTFEPLFQLYRPALDTYWPAQLHNDWLETRITFGWVGSALILAAFLTVVLRWFVPGGIHGGRRLVFLIWLALAGCLVHARYDFPFQVYSVLFTAVMLCAVLSVLSRRA